MRKNNDNVMKITKNMAKFGERYHFYRLTIGGSGQNLNNVKSFGQESNAVA